MAAVAPGMAWREDLLWPDGRPARGWVGTVPRWAADREKPAGVDELLDGRQLELTILYPEAFPAVPPALFPVDPEVPLDRRTLHQWHVNGNGSLCLMQAADDWQLTDTAADLLRKAAGWFIEYLLVEAGEIDAMTLAGIFNSSELDEILATHAS